ncbi:MAG: hypothetical protein ACREQE_03865 [Candidatus Binataceae bacterium]
MRELRLARVALRQIDITIAQLAQRVMNVVGDAGAPVIALVDSPRWPRDLDCSFPGVRRREAGIRGRHIDAVLRALTAYLATRDTFRHMERLSMFPTPPLAYFTRCLGEGCKPHLRALGRELFATELTIDSAPVWGGAIFTRFMLAGFAVYRALELCRIEAFEAYPDLQFRLRSPALVSKKRTADALASRQALIARLAAAHGIEGAGTIRTLDQADAAILALSALAARRSGAFLSLEDPGEGRFGLALDDEAAGALG